MAWAVRASLKAVLGKGRQGGAARDANGTPDAAAGRVSLLVEMESSSVGTVEITTDMTVRDVRVELHLSHGGEPAPDGGAAN